MASELELDSVIFGGGAAGLWLLDEPLHRGLRVVLLEADALGAGQTIASQGIIHGGFKSALSALLGGAPGVLADMPAIWRSCLKGERNPRLVQTHVRSSSCCVWAARGRIARAPFWFAR